MFIEACQCLDGPICWFHDVDGQTYICFNMLIRVWIGALEYESLYYCNITVYVESRGYLIISKLSDVKILPTIKIVKLRET